MIFKHNLKPHSTLRIYKRNLSKKNIIWRIIQVLKTDWFWPMVMFFLTLGSLIFVFLEQKSLSGQLALQQKSQNVSSLNILDDRWLSEDMLRARKIFCEDWLEDPDTNSLSGEYIAEFFETIAIYQKYSAIPDDFIWETYSYYIEAYFLLNKKMILEYQEIDKTLFENFSNLYETMKKISAEKNAKTEYSTKDLRDFALEEIIKVSLVLNLGDNSNSLSFQPLSSPTIELVGTQTQIPKFTPTIIPFSLVENPCKGERILFSKYHVTVERRGECHIVLNPGEVLIGTADRFQEDVDLIQGTQVPCTAFLIEGPIEVDIKIWWGGWDYYSNLLDPQVKLDYLNTKILECNNNHPNRATQVVILP